VHRPLPLHAFPMIPRLLVACLGLAAATLAQSPLNTIPTPPPNNWFLWTGCATPTVFFNLTVNTPVTIQGLDVSLDNLLGATGTIDMYTTTTATTHVGNETNPNAWTLRASAPVVAGGQIVPVRATFPNGFVLAPGTYGVAVRYNGVRAEFVQGTGTNQTFSTAEMTLNAGSVQALNFASASFPNYVWLGRIHYLPGGGTSVGASNTPYGTACNVVNGSFYQRFTCSNFATTALNGRSLSLILNGGGYIVVPGTSPFVAPTAAAVSLPTNDDGETPINLTNVLSYPGGVTQQLFVHTNGFVSVGSNNAMTPNNFTPFVPGLLNAPQTGWFSWHDYNTAEAGSGTIKFEEVGPIAYVTWDNVESWPALNGTTPVVNRSTFQFQFDTSSGTVNYVWQTITPQGTSVDGDEHVIGFSTGGPSPDAGPIDIATFTSAVLTTPERLPLRLDAVNQPVLGGSVDYVTSNETGVSLGLMFLSVVQLPSIPLAVLGMPGCAANVDINAGVGNLISNTGLPGTSLTITLPIPSNPGLLGFEVFGQSIWLDAAANAFGAIASNGVRTRIGNF
jgi:hypothetical protein